MNKVKIINNKIVYSSNFMFIESEGNWVTNPTEEQLLKEGYKDMIDEFSNVTEITYEDRESYIVRLLPIPEDLSQEIIDAMETNDVPENIKGIDTESEYDASTIEEKKSILNWFRNLFK